MASSEFINIIKRDDNNAFLEWIDTNSFIKSKSCSLCNNRNAPQSLKCTKIQRTFYYDLTNKLKLKHEHHIKFQ